MNKSKQSPNNRLLSNKMNRLQAITTLKLNIADQLEKMAQGRVSGSDSLILRGQSEGLQEAAKFVRKTIG